LVYVVLAVLCSSVRSQVFGLGRNLLSSKLIRAWHVGAVGNVTVHNSIEVIYR